MESVRPSTHSIARISSVLLRRIEKNHQDERRIVSIERPVIEIACYCNEHGITRKQRIKELGLNVSI